MNGNKKLLFIETFLLGDLIYLGPLLSVVRKRLPDAQIEVLASDATLGFPFYEPLTAIIHHFDFPWTHIGWHKKPFQLIKALATFRRKYFQQFQDYVVIDSRGDIRHAIVGRLLGPRKFIQYRSGEKYINRWRGVSGSHIFNTRQEFIRQIAEEFGLTPKTVLPWPWLVDFGEKCQNELKRTVLLAPEASNPIKHWKSERWKLLAKQLKNIGWCSVLVMHRGDALSDIGADDFDMVWKGSLTNLSRLIMCSQAMIAVDSFSGHLAAAMDIPVVSLFGATSPEQWRPWGGKTSVVVADGFPCRPCDQKHCVHLNDNCMDAIQVDDVLQAFQKLFDH